MPARPSSGERDVHYVQPTFDELGEPLREATFVVVDLETTGGAPGANGITEIGAVKVRGGEVLGEFQTLIDPGVGIPPFVQVLTGITDLMVLGAPRIDSVLPAFLEFAGFAHGNVLVAHNAPYDVGFLKTACVTHDLRWPGPRTVDTALLARRLLTRDEVPNCKLGTLAGHFDARTTPNHRALEDARATADVLHALLERLGPVGVQSLSELEDFSRHVTDEQRRKRHLAADLPSAPGVYVFRDARGEALYVGTSRDIRKRVRAYFTASEPRARMREMVGLTERVDAIVCAHDLEAQVRELRLIADLAPRYNRRSRHPDRAVWLKLTDEPFPRLSLVRRVRTDAAAYLGPFGSRFAAEQAMHAIHDAAPLRQCTQHLSPTKPGKACVLADLGRCGAPCVGRQTVDEYADIAGTVRRAMGGELDHLVSPLLRRIDSLSAGERYEDATVVRDRLAALVRASARLSRLRSVTELAELVAARPDGDGGWEFAVVHYGRLVAAGGAPRGAAPRPYVDALRATAETVLPTPGPLPAATAEETECVLRWLDTPGTRLVEVEGVFVRLAGGAGRWEHWLRQVNAGRAATSPFADRRSLRTWERPTRSGVA